MDIDEERQRELDKITSDLEESLGAIQYDGSSYANPGFELPDDLIPVDNLSEVARLQRVEDFEGNKNFYFILTF